MNEFIKYRQTKVKERTAGSGWMHRMTSSNQGLTASIRDDRGSLAETAMLEPLTERECTRRAQHAPADPTRAFYTVGTQW